MTAVTPRPTVVSCYRGLHGESYVRVLIVCGLTVISMNIRQTQFDLYIHTNCYFWATNFGLITTIIQAP